MPLCTLTLLGTFGSMNVNIHETGLGTLWHVLIELGMFIKQAAQSGEILITKKLSIFHHFLVKTGLAVL